MTSIIDIIEERSTGVSTENTYDGEGTSDSGIAPHWRTDQLLQDYKEYKAARIIQKAARCWYTRLIYLRKRAGAIQIQRMWRGFYYRRYFFRYLEDTLQSRIEKHYYDMAVRIQAWWRGWRVRLYIHDHYALLRAQVRAAEELLQCVAYKLHHLIRTKQIPGIYSLKNTTALSKVEQLIAALNFMPYGTRTLMPALSGKSINAQSIAGNPKCLEFYKEKDIDEKMSTLLKIYDRMLETDPRVKRKSMENKSKGRKSTAKSGETFCSTIIKSLRKWRFLTHDGRVSTESLNTAENLDSFLNEMRSLYNRINSNPCVCYAIPH